MKRTHRTAHRSIWIIAAPLLICVLIAALACRQEAPLNGALTGVAFAEKR